MLSTILLGLAVLAADTPVAVRPAPADTSPRPARSFSFVAENDAFYWGVDDATDQHYTNGVQAVWTTLWWPRLLRAPEPPVDEETGFVTKSSWWPRQECDQRSMNPPPQTCGAVTLGIGQTMYTPRTLQRGDTIDDDRPFVGFAYVTGSLHILRDRHTIGLDLEAGVIGSAAAAQYTQSMAHWWWAPEAVLPQGWNNQLSNQPAVNLGVRYSYLVSTREVLGGLTLDAAPRARLQFGNVAGAVRAGAKVRGGWNMPREFTFGRIGTTGVRKLRSAWNVIASGSYFVTAEWEERAVAYNALVTGGAMDGDVWRRNLRLESRGRDLLLGGSIQIGGVTLSQQWVHRSPEFTSRTGSELDRLDHRFGITSVSLTRGF